MTTIENYNLNDHLTDCEIITETYPRWEDESIVFKKKQLSDELTLFLFESGQAALEIGKNETGCAELEFLWTEEVAKTFDNINYINALELFAVVSREGVAII